MLPDHVMELARDAGVFGCHRLARLHVALELELGSAGREHVGLQPHHPHCRASEQCDDQADDRVDETLGLRPGEDQDGHVADEGDDPGGGDPRNGRAIPYRVESEHRRDRGHDLVLGIRARRDAERVAADGDRNDRDGRDVPPRERQRRQGGGDDLRRLGRGVGEQLDERGGEQGRRERRVDDPGTQPFGKHAANVTLA